MGLHLFLLKMEVLLLLVLHLLLLLKFLLLLKLELLLHDMHALLMFGLIHLHTPQMPLLLLLTTHLLLEASLWVEVQHLPPQQLLHVLQSEVHLLKDKVVEDRPHVHHLVGVVQVSKVRVCKGGVDADAVAGIEAEHHSEQIDGEGVCAGKDDGEGDGLLLSEGENEVAGVLARDVGEVVVRRRAEDVSDTLDLMHKVAALEERGAEVELREDAAD